MEYLSWVFGELRICLADDEGGIWDIWLGVNWV